MLTQKARVTPHFAIQAWLHACAVAANSHTKMAQSCQYNWFNSLPFQQFQALLTLFSKSFSPFPHGTCSLSVPSQYLALDEIYHHLCAPVPRNVTLRKQTVNSGLQMACRILTHSDALSQEACICAAVGHTSRCYNSRPEAPISKPSLSLFVRHYSGNPV